MRRVLLAAALALSWACCTLPASAGDGEIIAACVQAELDASRPPLNCVGRVSDPCLELPEGQSTVGMVECIGKETKVWDDMLNAEYGRLLEVLSSKAADAVRSAQRNWITLRDSDCKIPYEIFEGGTMAQPIAADCVRSHTADRALQVRAWREMARPE
ncbi:MAG: lysozyme inhibitor LprI family protein [Hyphomicrobium sp.]